MLEVEVKYVLENETAFHERLVGMGAEPGDPEEHSDTYLRHPSRDFVSTNEALRIRRINSVASVTYKGPKLPMGHAALKARKEIEWCLAPNDADGSQMTDLLLSLGFSVVATVEKHRLSYNWPGNDPRHSPFSVTLDRVNHVGMFAEVELLIDETGGEQASQAGTQIEQLAGKLGLTRTVGESYLELFLKKRDASS